MGQTRFVRRSLAALSTELRRQGYSACPTTVARLLRSQHFSPRINVKRFTGPDHPDRDRQFVNIREWIDIFEELGLPIISVDGKKKELIGNFKNAGAVWCDEPEEVNVYDFPTDAECRATPLRDLRPAVGSGPRLRLAPRRTRRRSPSSRSERGGHATAASDTGGRANC